MSFHAGGFGACGPSQLVGRRRAPAASAPVLHPQLQLQTFIHTSWAGGEMRGLSPKTAGAMQAGERSMGKVWEVAAAGDSSVPSTPREGSSGKASWIRAAHRSQSIPGRLCVTQVRHVPKLQVSECKFSA